MGLKNEVLTNKIQEASDSGNYSKVFELLSKDNKLSERFLSEILDAENFVELVKVATDGWKKILDQNHSANSETIKMISETREGIQKYLDENAEILSREERQTVLVQIMDLAKMIMQLDKGNKSFQLSMGGIIATGLSVLGVVGMALLIQKDDVIDMVAKGEDGDRN